MQKRINYSLLLAAVIVVFSSSTATAIKLDENRIGAISQNCSIIRERLRRIESAGAKSRVYLGTQYESVYSGLMSNFSLRLMRNGIAKQDIADQQAAFESERERFRNDFIGYSQELQTLISMDCRNEPEKFYQQLELTRTKREDIAKSINRLNEIIAKHRKSILDIRADLAGNADE
ncbi:hypothetical protein J6X15_01060 [Candidatus Saccharibacteria bacterium]|nr:hypothetical protein [Candidatus Saccharibacteria bacterium]